MCFTIRLPARSASVINSRSASSLLFTVADALRLSGLVGLHILSRAGEKTLPGANLIAEGPDLGLLLLPDRFKGLLLCKQSGTRSGYSVPVLQNRIEVLSVLPGYRRQISRSTQQVENRIDRQEHL